jgi:oxysterol-binding protein-related protein 9/10/11
LQPSRHSFQAKTEKKPLNPILGELFLGTYIAAPGEKLIELISEQVSHHPPITAYRINTPYNITLTGHNGADLAFKGGSIVVKQTGHAQLVVTLPDNTEEIFYITLPDLKIQGLISFMPYVELDRTTYISSSTGYIATIEYTGRGWIYGQKNSFSATLSKDKKPLYKVSGQWTGESTYSVVDDPEKKDIPFWDARSNNPIHVAVIPIDKQSPWESRTVWKNVAEAIEKNDIDTAGRHKSAIEVGQRKMREEELKAGETWKQRFFVWTDYDETASELRAELVALTGNGMTEEVGSWTFAPDEEDSNMIKSGKLFEAVETADINEIPDSETD